VGVQREGDGVPRRDLNPDGGAQPHPRRPAPSLLLQHGVSKAIEFPVLTHLF